MMTCRQPEFSACAIRFWTHFSLREVSALLKGCLCCQLNRETLFVRATPSRSEVPHDGPQALDVPGDYSQGDITLKTIEAMIPAEFKAMNPQSVDRGFDCGVLLPGRHEFRG